VSAFELATAGRVLFGAGAQRQVAAAVAATGARQVLLVTVCETRCPAGLPALRGGGLYAVFTCASVPLKQCPLNSVPETAPLA
jgi:hypothetical protein